MREEIMDYMQLNSYKPLSGEDLARELQIKDRAEFLAVLEEMTAQGEIILNRKGKYGLPSKMNLVVGRIQAHAKGFAFLIPDDPNEQDIYLKNDDLNGAMHNDRVIVRPYKNLAEKGKPEGEVIRILYRANEKIVGTYESSRYFGFVIPDEKRLGQDIFIPKNEINGATEGDKVVVEITSWPEPRRSPEGKIIEVLGHKDDPGIDILSVVRKYQLPEDFPAEVIRAAEEIPQIVAPAEYAQRRDLRDLLMVTIDGEDAKDLDDAVSLEVLPNGNYYLGVHIADVGHYVQEGSILDQEAFRRGTSVYLVDRVIPMLPPQLSNGICSLKAGEDRLAMSCVMEINSQGETVSYEIFPSVIKVRERMTYRDVRLILEEEEAELLKRYHDLIPLFKNMRELCLILRAKRLKRGAIDFEFPESKVLLDEQGKPLEIVLRERTIAEMLIEEFMIAANETVAEHFYWLEMPFLYRVHEAPDTDDLNSLNEFLGIFGYHVKVDNQGKVKPQAFQLIVEKVKGEPEQRAVSMTLLRSMKHACYADEALGHFGLAAKYYSHFTAPIRRYPDLAIHRVIKEFQEKGSISGQRLKKLSKLMPEYAEQSSLRERVAEEAERESQELKKVEYMKNFVGDVFEGHISGVTPFGFFVELPNTVEGLVHVSTLNDDYYQYVEKHLLLLGEHTKKTYRIGDPVKVVLTKVNMEEHNLDFEVVIEEEKKPGKKTGNLDRTVKTGIIKRRRKG